MNFKLIQLSCPYENWSDPRCQEVFSWVVSLNRDGYSSKYGKKILPLDSSAFLGEHIVVLAPTASGEWKPAMCHRAVSAEQLERYHQAFPMIGIAQAAGQTEHVKAVKQILERARKQYIDVQYIAGWTISREFRKIPGFGERLKNLWVPLQLLAGETSGRRFELVGAGVERVGTGNVCFEAGYGTMRLGSEELALVKSAYMGGEPVRYLHLTHPSAWALKIVDEIRGEWNRREWIGKPSDSELQEAA